MAVADAYCLVNSILSFQSFGGYGTANATSSIAAICFYLYHLTAACLYLSAMPYVSMSYSFKTWKNGWLPPSDTDLN